MVFCREFVRQVRGWNFGKPKRLVDKLINIEVRARQLKSSLLDLLFNNFDFVFSILDVDSKYGFLNIFYTTVAVS